MRMPASLVVGFALLVGSGGGCGDTSPADGATEGDTDDSEDTGSEGPVAAPESTTGTSDMPTSAGEDPSTDGPAPASTDTTSASTEGSSGSDSTDSTGVESPTTVGADTDDTDTDAGETAGGDTDGSDTGGADTDGSETGGRDTDSSDAGGTDTGGADTGGTDTGVADTTSGAASGAATSVGDSTGGAADTGSTGGEDTGGVETTCGVEGCADPLAEGLLLHYTFEDRSGTTILDMSGNGRSGALLDGAFVSSPWGEAVALDGVDDYISLVGPRNPALYGGVDGAATMHARVRVVDVEHLNTLCVNCGPWSTVYVGTDVYGPRVLAGVYDQSTGAKLWPWSTPALEADTWIDLTMIIEGGVGVRYYLGCELDTQIDNVNVGLHDYNTSTIGLGTEAWRWFEGEIDDIRIWDRALSDEELALACSQPS